MSIQINDMEYINDRYEWDSTHGLWRKTSHGEPKLMLRMTYDLSNDRTHYYIADIDDNGFDLQHTARKPTGVFFFPCSRAKNHTIQLIGYNIDQLVSSQKIGDKYILTYASGLVLTRYEIPFYHPKTDIIKSTPIKLDESIRTYEHPVGLIWSIPSDPSDNETYVDESSDE